MKKILPVFWYFVILFTLPFFFVFMTLKNNAATSWLMNVMSILFFVVLLVDIISAFILLLLGSIIGWISFLLCSGTFLFNPGTITPSSIIVTYLAAIIIGFFFAKNREIIQREKLQTIKLLSSTIAHELRTPLATVKLCASGVRTYMKSLIESYQIARTHNLPVPVIENEILNSIPDNLDSINLEADSAFVFIDMLLMNVNQHEFSQNLTTCSMHHCIQSALARYPFKGDEKSKVHLKLDAEDFNFLGSEMLMIHVLFNLIKNALYYIAAKPTSGDITVTTKVGTPNMLYFKDTGTGIAKDTLPHIFDRFFSRTRHGTGIGLAFCKMVIEAFGGKIYCRSEEGEYTEFVIELPPIK